MVARPLQRGPFSSRRHFSAVELFILWALVLWAIIPLHRRWKEEARDRRAALAVDWSEYRDFSARLAQSPFQLMTDLRSRGVTALIISPMTLNDLLLQHRAQPMGPSLSSDPLDVSRLRISDPVLAHQLWTQLSWRNIPGLQIRSEGKASVISRSSGGFSALKDVDQGFDPLLIAQTRTAGLTPVLRIFGDPWLAETHFKEWLEALPSASPRLGILFSSDDLQGGTVNGGLWRAWMSRNSVTQFLPEFHPAAAAWQMAYGFPAHAFRAHSIATAELKDLKAEQQLARWHRAVVERACRLLVIRMAANDSQDTFLASITALKDLLKRHGWRISFPAPRVTWNPVTPFQRVAAPILAFGIICLTPWAALRASRNTFPRWRASFWRIAGICLAGALLAAAVADSPYTRVEIIPFRGVKWAFLASWLLTLLPLYQWKELRWILQQNVRRRDVLIGGLAAAAIGYLILRSGNAPAAFKPSWEQSLRDLLETVLIARPRFKEFAIGHPALWVGCYLQTLYHQRRILWDSRVLIWVGMIGPISMINTFCHLHSPLGLELLRSFNGLVLGVLIGSVVVRVIRRRVLSRPQISFAFVQDEDAWFQRTS